MTLVLQNIVRLQSGQLGKINKKQVEYKINCRKKY